MGKAKHPHDASRPESKAVLAALEANDMEALEFALSPRQLAFCREYVVDFNGAAACIRAGYSTNWPDRQAYALMRNAGVRKYIEYLQTSKVAAIVSVNPDYIIQQVTAIISKETAKDGDKLRGLEMLARHLGMFVDRTEISGPDGEAIRLAQEKVANEAADFMTQLKIIAKKNQETVVEE